MPTDYYETLGVTRDAEPDQIKKAFRRLARELHPDVNDHDPEAESKFKEAAEAYEVLSDPERRGTYDRFGHDGLRSGGWAPGAGGPGGIQDIFDAFFGGDPFRQQTGPSSGADIGVRVEVGLEELVAGTTREVSFEAINPCDGCDGEGAADGSGFNECDVCDGTGEVRRVSDGIFGRVLSSSPCDRCGGAGRVPDRPCEECGGAGRIAGRRSWEVDVPAGIEDGQRIRINGAGHAGQPGAPPGDLYVEVRIEPDDRFARRDTEIYTRAETGVTTAMLGGEVMIESLDGPETLEVPAGSQQGDEILLKGHGLPELGGGRRGDLHAIVEIRIPRKLSRKQREAARRLAEELD
jgi:molecular chaperone DnaJ